DDPLEQEASAVVPRQRHRFRRGQRLPVGGPDRVETRRLGSRWTDKPGLGPIGVGRAGRREQSDIRALRVDRVVVILEDDIVDDIILKDYHDTVDPKSANVRLFSPPGAPDAYWAETGFVSPAGAKTPGLDTVWAADRQTLTPAKPVTLTWDNGAGLLFKRVI